MKKKLCLISAITLFLMSACTYQKNNTIDQKDPNDGDTYVYGLGKDSMARQLKVTYEPKPENEARIAKIKEIIYGSEVADSHPVAIAADSVTTP